MVTQAHTVSFLGVDAQPVAVECALSPGLPAFNPAYSPNPARLASIGGFAARDVLSLGL